MRRSLSLLLALSVGAVTLASCSDDNAVRVVDASALRGEFGSSTVDAATELLADAGVEVRIRPADDPLMAVESPSRVGLLRFQVRNMALEVNRGGGFAGADLDALAEAAGGAPVSRLIVAWATTANTRAARMAGQLLGDVTATPAGSLTIPGFVAALFLADVTRRSPAGASLRQIAMERDGRVAGSDEPDFCASISEYLAAVLGGVLDPTLDIGPPWLGDALDRFTDLESDPARLRAGIGALALAAYATSISKPWVPLLISNPGEAHYIVDEDELTAPGKELRLSVDRGEAYIAEEAQECAALADLELPEREIEGTPVGWLVEGLAPHITQATQTDVLVPDAFTVEEGPEGDLELDEFGNAVFSYQTRGETDEAHSDGTLQTFTIPVGVVLQRKEIQDVRDAVERVLTGGALGGAGGAEVASRWAALQERLDRLLLPAANTTVTITRHVEEPPDDDTGMPGDECGDGCAASTGDPHLVPVSGASYDFQATGEYTLLRSADGSLEIQARQEPWADSRTVSITTALAVRAGDRRITIDTRGGDVVVRVDGEVVEPTQRMDLGDGAHLAPYALGVEVGFPDGTVLWSTMLQGLEVLVRPSDELRASGMGLLGPASDDGARLPLLPDGTVLPEANTAGEYHDRRYEELGPAWRVDTSSSLFDYGPGESPDAFFDPEFPERPLEWSDLSAAQLALGAEACADITFVPLRQACVFDVAVTGDAGYADVYDTVWGILDEAFAALGEPGPIIVTPAAPTPSSPTPTPPPSDPPPDDVVVTETTTPPTSGEVAEPVAGEPTLTLSGNLAASYSPQAFDDDVVVELTGRFRGVSGSVVLLRADGCTEGTVVFAELTEVERETTAFGQVCPGGVSGVVADEDDEQVPGEAYLWLADDGVYELRLESNSETPTPLTVELFTDPTPTIVSQDDVLDTGHTATIAGTGDTVVYTFDGTADTSPTLVGRGFDRACVIEAYGAPLPGSGVVWDLSAPCIHQDDPGSGLAGSGVEVPVVAFARTDESIEIGLERAN